ncbi:hypothetical protein TYRP_023390 [Tyrophagus putrescentiae]|nr:hypothetical protein TYRP_023390 [Tyrophagus putrescentiae]
MQFNQSNSDEDSSAIRSSLYLLYPYICHNRGYQLTNEECPLFSYAFPWQQLAREWSTISSEVGLLVLQAPLFAPHQRHSLPDMAQYSTVNRPKD